MNQRVSRRYLTIGRGSTMPVDYRLYEETAIGDVARPVCDSLYRDAAVGFVMSGWFEYRSRGDAMTAVPGALVFGNCGEQFSIHNRDCPANRRLVVRYDGRYLDEVAAAHGLDGPQFRAAALPPCKEAAVVFARMRALARSGLDNEGAAFALASAVLRIGSSRPFRNDVSGRESRRILAVVRYIESSYRDPCTTDMLAGVSGYSRYHFMRLFKAVTGQSPKQYVINTRLRAAALRIMETTALVSEIALDVGFNDISHFNNHFRALFDCTPRQMRNEPSRRAA
jgi:AraC family transcriptional regulator